MPTNTGKKKTDLEAAHRHSKRGVSATTSPRHSGRGTTGTTPAAAVTGTGGAAADAVSDIVGATAAVNKSSRRSGRIAVFDAAASTTAINAKSSAHSQPTATFSGHRQASINSGRNLDIHDAARLPVPSIQDTDNISEYISSEDDSSMYSMTIKKKTTLLEIMCCQPLRK